MVKISLIEKMILNKEEVKELLRLRNSSKASSVSILERKKKYRLYEPLDYVHEMAHKEEDAMWN